MSESLARQAGQSLPPYQGCNALANTYDAQRVIRWGCFLEGGLFRDWKTVQDTHFIMIRNRKMGSVWARGLIKHLLKSRFLCLVASQLLATQ
jgi:hypothetical protein